MICIDKYIYTKIEHSRAKTNTNMQDIFHKIITREIQAHIIWESDTQIAFLDINPIYPGHTLLVPKKQIDYIFDIPEKEYTELMLAAKEIAIILKDKLKSKRVGVLIEGFLIPHAHIHLVPLEEGSQLDPEKAKPASDADLLTIKNKILS